jgi:hypothetical protein
VDAGPPLRRRLLRLVDLPRDADRFEAFWSLVADCLRPAGRVFFIDDAYRAPDELIEGESSSTIRRCLNDGTAYRAFKVPYRPADLEAGSSGSGGSSP